MECFFPYLKALIRKKDVMSIIKFQLFIKYLIYHIRKSLIATTIEALKEIQFKIFCHLNEKSFSYYQKVLNVKNL